MGNVCPCTFAGDEIISRCLDCSVRKVGYISELQDNLVALQRELDKLTEAREDVKTRADVAEQQHMKLKKTVEGWLSRAQQAESEAERLIKEGGPEVEKLCLGGFCSKNCITSYKFGKQVFKALQDVDKLINEGDFTDVAQTLPENPVDERPIPPTVVGLQPTFDKVWRYLTKEKGGIIGIYGMGGVGKTTLLTQINNKFLDTPSDYVVIWAVASKDLELENFQESIAKKIGLFNESWKSKTLQEKAQEIFKILSKKKYVLLLDDIWEEVDLTKVGLPVPSPKNASEVIFTTREYEVCCRMDAHKSFKVECLRYEDARRLFEEKVGRDILDSHSDIPELAKTVVTECGGLPLALIVVGRAMACKKTRQEWELAIDLLRISASKLEGMNERVYSPLKVSYDFLPSDTLRFCLLYCSLFPEDFSINREDLIDHWICEGILDEYDGIVARNQGYSIISTLVHACLLEEHENNCVKMHDVIRDMALWITSTIEKEKEKFLVLAGVGLTEAPSIGMWKDVTRMSLMKNKIQSLLESPKCPRLQTLFLSWNEIKMVGSNFFQSLTSLKVLSLSNNPSLHQLPDRFSALTSLQHLNLSFSKIEGLPEELKCLVNLKCLNLEFTSSLRTIQPRLIYSLKKLRILRMISCGKIQQEEDSILFGGSELLVEELFGLKHLNVLTIDLRSFHALQTFFSYPGLQSSTRSLRLQYLHHSKSVSVTSLARLKHLDGLELWYCRNLEELKIDYTGGAKNIRETHGFNSLHIVDINHCSKLMHVTWLIFAPNLKRIQIEHCMNMEEIIKLDEVPAELVENLIPFARLQFLRLRYLENLKSIYQNALPFPRLKELIVEECPKLKKLPLDRNSASGSKFIIKGKESWWTELQWDDQATLNAFRPCFKSIG